MYDKATYRIVSHHGITGQKHGVRRYQYKDGSLTPLGRIRYGKGKPRKSSKKKSVKDEINEEVEKRKKRKSASEMTDEEINAAINRLRLEQTYNQLMASMSPKEQKKAESKAKKLIGEIAYSSFKNIGTQAATYATGAAVNKIARKVFNINFDIVNPKAGQKQQQQRSND